jgi:pimeloyl-ACP methyl ester carboxylesterase
MKKQHYFILIFLMFTTPCLSQVVISAPDSLMSHLERKNFDRAEALFDERLLSKIDSEKLSLIWSQLVSNFGRYIGSERVSTNTVQDTLVRVQFSSRFESSVLTTTIATNINTGKIAGLFFSPFKQYSSPSYVRSTEFASDALTLKTDDQKIHGVIVRPKSKFNGDVLILIPGSGRVDKDVTIGPNKIFKDLAEGLGTFGISSFRYDKATFTDPQFSPNSLDDEYLIQLRSIVEQFSKCDSIKRIFLVGHSLGGWAAIQAASLDNKIGGMILLATPVTKISTTIENQGKYLLKQIGAKSADSTQYVELIQNAQRLNSGRFSDGEMFLGMSEQYWKSVEAFDPVKAFKRVAVPVIVVNGGRDYQVPASDMSNWASATNGITKIEALVINNLNHLFQRGDSASTPSEYLEPKSVDLTCMTALVDWIRSQ